jgi:hypothetical protein
VRVRVLYRSRRSNHLPLLTDGQTTCPASLTACPWNRGSRPCFGYLWTCSCNGGKTFYVNNDESNGCGKEFTQLHVMLELLKFKASHGWSDNSFSKLLCLIEKILPKPNTLPTSTFKAKKLRCPLSLGVDKIQACPNHCILYSKGYEFNMKCLVCGVSQYKRSYNHVYADTMKKKIKK